MIGLFRKRQSYRGMDWGPYKSVASKWTNLFFLYTLPLLYSLLGLCGWPYYLEYRFARKVSRRVHFHRRTLLFSSIPVNWRKQAYDLLPDF